MSVSVDGTASVFAATARLARPVPVLVSGSSEVYGAPHPKDLPLRETASLRAVRAYGRSKLEQERTATRLGREFGLPTVVTRSFNHTGPGQRHEFVVPALAARIIEAAALALPSVRAGNVDVRRDIGDVRDVVRAYRLLLELAARTRPATPLIVNVCTGQGVAIREVIAMLADAAHATVDVTVDPQLVREDDPPEIVGDPTLLRDLTGWRPEIPLASTLADVLEDARRSSATPT
jgi:GDP-4-dehydro-6-deoxy-D-mannose reductase